MKKGYMEKVNFTVGSKVIMKKGHPCGTNLWEIQRVGMDFRIKCCGCGRSIMIPRKTFEKSFKAFSDE